MRHIALIRAIWIGLMVTAHLTLVTGMVEPATESPKSADEWTPTKLALRHRPDKKRQAHLNQKMPIQHIVVKFHDGTRVRLHGTALQAETKSRNPRDLHTLRRLGVSDKQILEDVTRVNHLLRGLQPLFPQDEETLASLRRTGESRRGHELADLSLYYGLPVDKETTFRDVAALVDALNALDSVEIAYAQPPSEPAQVDIPPITPNFESIQGYLETAPGGIDARYAWTIPGGNGTGVRVVDIEDGWQTTHEDMPPLFYEGKTTEPVSPGDNSHGTAVLGVMVGAKNEYGVTGIAWGAQAGYQRFVPLSQDSTISDPTEGAIIYAAEAVRPGGIVLIEAHNWGPCDNDPRQPGENCLIKECNSCNSGGCGLVALEYWQAVFDAIQTVTANGVIVVEPAGNGSANLDDIRYGRLFDRTFRDSGAILVGADEGGTRIPACWTNHGSRIDAFGWGGNVMTMGGGDLFDGQDGDGGDRDQYYTSGFGGTSSASPIVAGAVADLQGVLLADGRQALNAWQMRDLLFRTGTPQIGVTPYIGRMPDLLSAINDIDNCPAIPNPDQTDSNSNGIGDACEADRDGDTIIDVSDNCPTTSNPDQTDSDGDGIGDACESVPPPTPQNLIATAEVNATSGAIQIGLQWGAVLGASYTIERSLNNSAYSTVTSSYISTTFLDSGLAVDTSYVYRVRAVNAAGTSAYSNIDFATTVDFRDEIARPFIYPQDVVALKTEVDAVHNGAGLHPAAAWTPFPTLQGGGYAVTMTQVQQLQDELKPAREALGAAGAPSLPAYADTTLVYITKSHLEELQKGVKGVPIQ